MPPKRSAACAMACSTCISSRTSTTNGSALPPWASIASAAVWMVPANLGCGLSVLAASTTLAPSRAARSPMARPMPRLAPVMNRVLPLRLKTSPPRELWRAGLPGVLRLG